MQEMKDQMKKVCNGWLIVNSLNSLSTRIKIDFIRQIEIEDDVIKIQIEEDWIIVRRYNQRTIEIRLGEIEISSKSVHFMNDFYFGEGTEKRQVKEDNENERYYLEHLDENLMVRRDWKEVCRKAYSTGISWLKDEDFEHLKKQLESLSDKFALNIKKEK